LLTSAEGQAVGALSNPVSARPVSVNRPPVAPLRDPPGCAPLAWPMPTILFFARPAAAAAAAATARLAWQQV